MIDLQYNFPLLAGQAGEWRERLRRAVDGLGGGNTGPGGANGELDAGSFDELRPTFRSDQTRLRAIAARWVGAPEERTWITAGGHHGSLLAMLAGELAGKPVAMDAVSYIGAITQARMLGATLVGCAVDAEGMTAKSLRERCIAAWVAGEPMAAVYTMPTVQNPLGCTAGLRRRKAIVAVAREFDLQIVEDAAYEYMEPDAAASYKDLAPERTFYVRGMSKSYAPATRTGVLVAPEKFAGAVSTALINSTTGTSLVHNVAAMSLIEDGTAGSIAAKKRIEGAQRNVAARKLLGDFAAPGAKAAWHLWVPLPEGTSSVAFAERLREREVVVSAGEYFEVVPGAGRGIRLALGGEVERERALEGVALVAEELGRL